MNLSGKFRFLVIIFLFAAINLNGQSFRFTNYGEGSKIPNLYIYTINQSDNGLLWIGHNSGLARFDGFEFYPVTFPDSVSNRMVTASLKDRLGRLWFGCSDGTLFYLSDGEIKKVPDLGIQTINDITEGIDNDIWVVPQERNLIRVDITNPDNITKFGFEPDILLTTACITQSGELFVGTQENLLFCSLSDDSVKIRKVVTGIEYSKIETIKPVSGSSFYLVGTDGMGIFKLSIVSGDPVLTQLSRRSEFEGIRVTSIIEDNEKNIWVTTFGSGVIRFRFKENGELNDQVTLFTMVSGLSGENINTVYQDMEGNKWLGFYEKGLSMLRSGAISFYAPGEDPEMNNIICVAGFGDDYFLGTDKGYYLFDPAEGKASEFVNLSREAGNREITALLPDKNKEILFATRSGKEGTGLFIRRLSGRTELFFRSGDTGENYISNIATDGTNIWLSTINGIIILDRKTGSVVRRITSENAIGHNSINQVLIMKNGKAVVANENDRVTFVEKDEKITLGATMESIRARNEILTLNEDRNGNLWAGTDGNGVFYFAGDSVHNITTGTGLFSNYCYSILSDSKGEVWIGHERGFSRYVRDSTGFEVVKVYPTDFARGGNCNPQAIFESSRGEILIGTTAGLIIFNREEERKVLGSPRNNIMKITVNDEPVRINSSYSFRYGTYNIKIDYVGINFNDPEKVYYSTRIDGLNNEWSDPTAQRSERFTLNKEGRYRFSLISVNEDRYSQEEPLYIDFIIRKPFWRTWWFILTLILTATGVIVLIIYERDKAHKRINKYLEDELAARTRVVMKQKEELQIQNMEITDSINYAKRIQSSILPDVNKLKESLSDAFIMFLPRDIVSGDFYWFDKISDEKFMLICADSTGHGVPGGFMSMIGSALLQDIILRKGITRPSEILTTLDRQIFSTLNQNIDIGVSNDGMDMVVCEINPKTRHIRFASAMRPVILVMEGEPYYVKGNRCSVGGEAVIEKYFDDQEYYLNEGDQIYLFSDGLPDQFGGADGKKMKIIRLKKLIEDISKLPMNEQKDAMLAFFAEWKGDFDQVDDVLFMGVKV